jgi:hypothetical protein
MRTAVEIKEAKAHLSPQEYCALMADLQPVSRRHFFVAAVADTSIQSCYSAASS